MVVRLLQFLHQRTGRHVRHVRELQIRQETERVMKYPEHGVELSSFCHNWWLQCAKQEILSGFSKERA